MAETVEILFLAGRLVFGGFFVYNGLNHLLKLEARAGYAEMKGVPAPTAATIVSGLMILAGGLGVITGTLPHTSLGLLILFLIPVTLKMHQFWTVEDGMQRAGERNQFTKNIALLGAALALFVVQTPWPLAL